MNISVSEASKRWGVSRTTIYKKIDDGELSRNSDKKIDTTEMLRVFGNPPSTERTEQNENNVQWTSVNSKAEQENVQLKHQLEMEKLKIVHLQQQVDHHKQLVENYQKQIDQLSKSLDKANASIQDFAQTKLLEMKGSLSGSSISQDENNSKDNQGDSEIVSSESNSKPATNQEAINTKGKKRWWSLSL